MFLIVDPIHQPVLFVDTAAPETGKISNQWFRFPQAVVSISYNVLKQLIDLPKGLTIFCLPVHIVFPAVFGKYFIHRSLLVQSMNRKTAFFHCFFDSISQS